MKQKKSGELMEANCVWINVGKIVDVDSIFVYANTIDMMWRLAIVKRSLWRNI